MLKLIFFIFFLSSLNLEAQDIINDISSQSRQRYQDLFTENILVISNSRKIFILSNENRRFTKGDFISLIINEELGARALVAKVDNDRVGIKIVKIYSLTQWAKMLPKKQVQVLIGDDSYYKKSEEKSEDDNLDQINSEEDLFKDNLDMDDFGDSDNSARHLKTDNIVGLTYGNFPGINADGTSTNHPQFAFSWAHQISDNIYAEGLLGYSKLDNFPADDGIQTVVTTISLRAKYSFKLPLYSYLMPFIGIDFLNVNSPEAGVGKTGVQKERELQLVEDLVPSKTNFIAGATLLRRLVPAWFLKLDAYINSKGKLHYSAGFAIEF